MTARGRLLARETASQRALGPGMRGGPAPHNAALSVRGTQTLRGEPSPLARLDAKPVLADTLVPA